MRQIRTEAFRTNFRGLAGAQNRKCLTEMSEQLVLLTSSRTSFYGFLVAIAASISGFCFGYEIGIIASVLEMDSFQLWTGTGYLNSTSGIVEVDAPSFTWLAAIPAVTSPQGLVCVIAIFNCCLVFVLVFSRARMLTKPMVGSCQCSYLVVPWAPS